MHLAVLGFTLGGEAEARFGLIASAKSEFGGEAADLGAVLEAMARSAADQHHIGHCRMAIDQEVAVRAILILADLGAGQIGRAHV